MILHLSERSHHRISIAADLLLHLPVLLRKVAAYFPSIILLSNTNIPHQFLYICLFFFFFFLVPHNKNVSLILILLLRQSKPSLLGMPYKSQKRRDSIMQDFI